MEDSTLTLDPASFPDTDSRPGPKKQDYGSDFLVTMRARFAAALSADDEDRKEAEDDVRMATEDQWEPEKRKARGKRPTLTENVLGPSIAQVCNDGRQNNPAIRCTPKDGGTEETAEYWQGRIRQIEYECDADIAYDTAREQQVTSGRGFYRVTTRYVKGNSGKQEACIEPIENQFSVLWDPSARRYDLSDAKWWFVIRSMSRDDFEREFGKNTVAGINNYWLSSTDQNPAPDWICGAGTEIIQVADYYTKEYDSDGSCTVRMYVTNGVESNLGDGDTEWIGSRVPIVPQWGKQLTVKGRKRTFSLIRFAKDPQRLVNLYVSNIAEQIAEMPKSPYIGAEGQFLGHEKEWTNQADPTAFRQYKVKEVGGQSIGPPVRVTNEPPIQALVEGYLRAKDAVKACTGIFDSSLGANKDDTSGVAIQKRQKESDVTNFHFSDNEARSRKALARILLEILPKLDGEEPAEKPVRGVDGKVKLVKINQPYTHEKTGRQVIHDMTEDPERYEPAISTGPSYTSQRAEENDRLGQLIQASPELMNVMGDLFFRTSDGPGADEMADRMERFIGIKTPGLIDKKSNDPKAQMQKITLQAQQLSQQNQQLTQLVHQLSQKLETGAVEQEGKFKIAQLQESTKVTLADLDRATKIALAEIETKAQTSARASADALAVLQAREAMAHDVGMAAMTQVHGEQSADAAADRAAAAADPNAGGDASAPDASAQPAPDQQPVQQ